MTPQETQELRQAFNIDMNNFSYTDIEELTYEKRLQDFWKGITLEECRSIMHQVEKEYDDLDEQYRLGDRDEYPPDWWDQYVFPIRVALNVIEEYYYDMLNNQMEDDNE